MDETVLERVCEGVEVGAVVREGEVEDGGRIEESWSVLLIECVDWRDLSLSLVVVRGCEVFVLLESVRLWLLDDFLDLPSAPKNFFERLLSGAFCGVS